jgi:holo-[acyl-carrier protein] synthase
MIWGIGVDIVENARFDKWVNNLGLIERYFAPHEVEECINKAEGMRNALAVRFAAKEAFVKALGIGFPSFILKEISVSKDTTGKPIFSLTGKTKIFFESLPHARVHLSLSHEENYSVATALVEVD